MWDPVLERYDISRRVSVHSYEEIRSRMDPGHPEHLGFYERAEDAALVIVDEAHNLRNAEKLRARRRWIGSSSRGGTRRRSCC